MCGKLVYYIIIVVGIKIDFLTRHVNTITSAWKAQAVVSESACSEPKSWAGYTKMQPAQCGTSKADRIALVHG